MVDWISDLLDQLTEMKTWGYAHDSENATEPVAMSTLALLSHGRFQTASRGFDWLHQQQLPDGTLGVTPSQTTPKWPTFLAILAWKMDDILGQDQQSTHRHGKSVDKAVDAMLQIKATIIPIRSDTPLRNRGVTHNTTLLGWPWVEGTHSWCEPTAMALMALRASGNDDQPRAKESVELLLDRILPTGGCNYGNTTVLGQMLRPHIQPTGLVLTALAGFDSSRKPIRNSLRYLQKTLCSQTATASLCWGLMGLASHGIFPSDGLSLLEHAYRRTRQFDQSAWKLALIALAALGNGSPLFAHCHTEEMFG